MTKIDLMKQVDKHNKQTKFEECEKKKDDKHNMQTNLKNVRKKKK